MSEHAQLILETRESISEYVPKLLAACDQIVAMVQSNETGWVDTFDQFLEGINWTISAISGIRRLQPDELSGISIDELIKLLPQLADALQQKDMVAVGDILQFELKPGLESILTNAG